MPINPSHPLQHRTPHTKTQPNQKYRNGIWERRIVLVQLKKEIKKEKLSLPSFD
jgi:hypothetical protein